MSANNKSDTIAAIATPPGQGGVGIVRISGPNAYDISKKILKKNLKPRLATYGAFYDKNNTVLDIGIALYFKSPHSFTGEDIVELQGHGGPIILDRILKEILNLKARIARPGEFTARAFLNDKIDLTQAEAISDLINANSEQAARAAVRSLQGDFASIIHKFLDSLIDLRTYIEAAIDFPDEEIDFISDGKIEKQLNKLRLELKNILKSTQQGVTLREGINIVLCGKPNSGKSTLLNALSGTDLAIVTNIAGTTRDVMRAEINLDGLPLHIIDTAGLRNSDDIIEQEGIRRAWEAIEKADLALWIKSFNDKTVDPEYKQLIKNYPHLNTITVFNKIDLSSEKEFHNKKTNDTVYLSAKNKIGLNDLSDLLKEKAGLKQNTEGLFIARRRHLDALNKVSTALDTALHHIQIQQAGELAAEECRIAQDALSEITGEFSSDDLLGNIFSSFCIGK